MPYRDRGTQRAYQAAWKERRRQEWIRANGPCQRCRSWEDLEVDHIDPITKEHEPTNIWSRKLEIRHKELQKCQVLCHYCHKTKSIKDLEILAHVSIQTYDAGCRCEHCLSFITQYRTKSYPQLNFGF